MKPIIDPIPVELLEAELTSDKFVRYTNYSDNHIYVFNHKNGPNLMREVGRMREVTFRSAGGGTGKEADIDQYDLADEHPYEQLIVWDPRQRRILGGYRYLHCKHARIDETGRVLLATSGLFSLSEEFKKDYLPYVIELGRSFVAPEYQSKTEGRRSIFTLDNLWDGLATLVIDNPDAKYFFGKVTMYTTFDQFSRDLILYFLKKHFNDPKKLMVPHSPLPFHHPEEELAKVLTATEYSEDYKTLSAQVRARGANIPPLINSYMNLTSSMATFGTAMNPNFGSVEETGILITIKDILPTKTKRHVVSYLEQIEARKNAE